MKILITNTVALNGGDAAILLAIIELLRREFGEDTEFVIYDSQPEIAGRYYPDLTFRKLLHLKLTELPQMKYLGQTLLGRILRYALKQVLCRYSRVKQFQFYIAAWCQRHQLRLITKLLLKNDEFQDLKHYSCADLIVSTGGTYLVEKYSLDSRIFDFKLSLLMQKPLVLYTQSLGPFNKFANQKALRPIFNQASLVLLRDQASLQHLQDLGVNGSNTYVSADVVFALQNRGALSENYHEQTRTSRLKVIISVRYWRLFSNVSSEVGMQKYQKALCALTQFLVEEHQAEITYLSTCQGITEYWTDDSRFATEVFNLLPDSIQKYVCVNREFHTPQVLLDLLSACDIVIATRMHMCILSLVAGNHVLPIAYEFKTKELFKRLGMGEWVQDIETIDEHSLVASAQKFLSALPEIKQRLPLEVRKEQERALNSGKLVKKTFEEWQKSKVK